MRLHRRTHPNLDVKGCFGCKVATVQFSCIDISAQKRWDAELDYYADLRKQGVQPAGTTHAKCEEADQISQETGKAFDASDPLKAIREEVAS